MIVTDPKQHLAPVWARYTDIVAHGEGTYLFAQDGRRYPDFTWGIGVTKTGHCRACSHDGTGSGSELFRRGRGW
jgi:acetylornithine/succinyldiaminopimelate/putrescine aminotransferase